MRTNREPTENVIRRFSVDLPDRAATEFLKIPGRLWDGLESALDQRLLVASYRERRSGGHTVLIDPRSKSELSNFEDSEFAWINAASYVQFEGFDPKAIVQLDDKQQVAVLNNWDGWK